MVRQDIEAVADERGREDPAPQRPSFSGTIGFPLLIAVVALSGAVLAGLGAWSWQGQDVAALLLLALLAAAAERFDISLYGDSRVSLAFVPIFSAILLFGLWGLAVVVTVAVVVSSVGVDRPVHKTMFNFGALMLAGAASVF